RPGRHEREIHPRRDPDGGRQAAAKSLPETSLSDLRGAHHPNLSNDAHTALASRFSTVARGYDRPRWKIDGRPEEDEQGDRRHSRSGKQQRGIIFEPFAEHASQKRAQWKSDSQRYERQQILGAGPQIFGTL